MITHTETKEVVFRAIEEYTEKKLEAGEALTPDEKNGHFFFPSSSDEFNQITLGTVLGKEKLFYLRNYLPKLRCTGVSLKGTSIKLQHTDPTYTLPIIANPLETVPQPD